MGSEESMKPLGGEQPNAILHVSGGERKPSFLSFLKDLKTPDGEVPPRRKERREEGHPEELVGVEAVSYNRRVTKVSC
eukprot:CAMPEP_0113500114 /NCGR_PEP_ID=MMETSP0014_2-20120614/32129_1 /TAXON_ID=2857 /ORGANISM="Nitzschia sp." /LENGTH=77 /DNA_ID=CAMNT_0000394375 /DNA_START=156 /DNA_END=389 /DNA_ORIENTATION=+ /assembly_acc=CAM_ASM_000159